MRRSLNLTLSMLRVGLVMALFACGGGESARTSPTPTGSANLTYSVNLSSETATLARGMSEQLSASIVDQFGRLHSGEVEWNSLDPAVAVVTRGQVTAVAAGVARIEARYGTASAMARVTVLDEQATLQVVPQAVQASVGDTLSFEARIQTSSTDWNASHVRWQSSDDAVASVDSAGTLHLSGEGDVSLVATVGSLNATALVRVSSTKVASVTVTPATVSTAVGASPTTFTVVARDASGRVVPNPSIDWGSSAPAIASIDQSGKMTPRAIGGAIISAVARGGARGTATVNVSAQPASSITLRINPDTITVGSWVQAVATPLDSVGNPLSGRPIAYQSSSPSVAQVSSSGRITALAAGTARISAICDGRIATVTVTVEVPRPKTINVVPAPATVVQGGTATLVADVLDQTGRSMSGVTVVWSSQSPSVATVSSTGVVKGLLPGSSLITASVGSVSGTSLLTVTKRPVASITVTPTAPAVDPGQTVPLSAVAYDSAGQSIAGTVFGWTSANTAIATVSSTGVVSGVAPGTVAISASSGAVSASVSVRVNNPAPAPVASVQVTLNSSSLTAGQSTQAVAVLRDAAANVLTGRPITWSSADTAIATVSSAGLVVSKRAGSVAISATSEGVTGFTTLTVSAPPALPPTTITVSAPDSTVMVGQSLQMTVVLRDKNGQEVVGAPISFTGRNATVLKVDPTGLVTGLAAGRSSVAVSSSGLRTSIEFDVTPASGGPAPVNSVVVTTPTASVNVGQSVQLLAQALDASGNPVNGVTFAWSSSNTGFATVSATGQVSAVAPGTVSVTATANGKSGSVSITVQAPAPAVATVTTTVASPLTVGKTAQAVAIAKDAAGNVIPGVSFTWASSQTSKATISSSGLVTAVAAGTTTITASSGGQSGGATLTVQAPAVATVAVSVAATLNVGQSTQATAVARDASGNVISGAAFTWSVSAPSVLSVNASGMVGGVAAGSAQVRATSGGVTGASTIAVSAQATPPGSYTYCVAAGNLCLFSGLRDVRLVASNGNAISQVAFGQVPCAAYGFGNQVPGPGSLFCDYGAVKRVSMNNPMPGMSGMPAVISAPMGNPGWNVARTTPSGGAPAPGGGSGSFRTQCSLTKFDFIDPIVYPGQVNASHLHMFFGNVGVNASSTPQSLVGTRSACRGGTLNATSYWAPAVFDTRTGEVMLPEEGTFYYKTGYGIDPAVVQPFPAGLRMIAGDKNATSRQTYVDWICENLAYSPQATIPTGCGTGGMIRLTVIFPQCWDGVNLDAPDHKSHMAYPIYRNPPQKSTCPSTHPITLPEITEHFDFKIEPGANPAFWRLSSDMYSSSMAGGMSAHADWMNGWDSATMTTIVRQCLNKALDCGVGSLGNGTDIY